MVGAAAKFDVARRIDADDDMKQDAVDICLKDRRARRLQRIIKLGCFSQFVILRICLFAMIADSCTENK